LFPPLRGARRWQLALRPQVRHGARREGGMTRGMIIMLVGVVVVGGGVFGFQIFMKP
jgi:hypothetical protein